MKDSEERGIACTLGRTPPIAHHRFARIGFDVSRAKESSGLQTGGSRDTARRCPRNLDLARRGYEAFARGDLDAAIEFMHPEIEAHDPPEVPDATVYRGREAVRRDWEQTSDL
jgi:SnoaL-like domain